MSRPSRRLMWRWAAVAGLAAACAVAFLILSRRSHTGSAVSPRSQAPPTPKRMPGTAKRFPAWWGQAGVQPRRIAGRVTYRATPVDGAVVRLTSEAVEAGAVSADSVTTSADGRFNFGVLPAAEYAVTAMAAGRTAAGQALDLRDPAGKPQPDQIELEVLDCAHGVYGQIQDAGGGAIAGARLQLRFGDAVVPLSFLDELRREHGDVARFRLGKLVCHLIAPRDGT